MNEYRGYYIFVTFSPSDGGYYAEVSNRNSETIYVTNVFKKHYKAEQVAKTLIDTKAKKHGA